MHISAKDIRSVLRQLSDLRYATDDLNQAFRRIVDATHKLFAVDGAGLMLVDPEQLLRNAAVSDQRVDELENLQAEYGEGPCVDAFADKQQCLAEDLASEQRWPRFTPAALNRGLAAVLASPIPYNRQAVGVVVVFSGRPRPWSPESELALIALTDVAAMALANAMQSEERGQLAQQLQHALDARTVIEQAKGALAARDLVSPREAFERLRRRARNQRRRVADVAAEVLAELEQKRGG